MADDRPNDGVAIEAPPLDDDYAGAPDREIEKVESADGTLIAFDRLGSGPPVVVIGAGLNDRLMFTPLAMAMAEHFTVINYDRRGRGDSGDGDVDAWSIDVEVQDLAAVLDAVGEPCHVFANCTGGVIGIRAASQGVPMLSLALYEPPYGSEPNTTEQVETLSRLVGQDRVEDAVTVFVRDVVGFLDDEAIGPFKSHPAWAAFQTMAVSTIYDTMIGRDCTELPVEELRRITVPTLTIRGEIGDSGIHEACAAIADEVPLGSLVTMEGHGHLLDQKAAAPYLIEYFRS